jgi:hypothetical protein
MRMPSDYDAYCELMDDPDPYADERAEEERYWRSLELSHNESLLEAIGEAVDDVLAGLPVDAPLTFTQRQLLWSALWGFCNDVVFFDERAELRGVA